MTAIKIRVLYRNDSHVNLRVFDGPDMEHLGCAGELMLTPDGALRLIKSLRTEAFSCGEGEARFAVEDTANGKA